MNFTISKGDKIGVLGLNGHGKSSLFKVLTEEVTPDHTTPAFIFDKARDFSVFLVPQELKDLNDWSIKDYFYCYYPELKKLKLKLKSIEEKMSDPQENLNKLIDEQGKILEKLVDLGEHELESKYTSYLKYFKLGDLDRMMITLSGGEQRKVALALGLSAKEELILWDEPTNHLDLDTIELFEDELMSQNKTFLLITHDRTLLHQVVDRVIHIQRGKLRSFEGTYEQYLQFLIEDQKRREKELDKLSNTHRRETAWMRQGVEARRTKSKKRIEDYGNLSEKISDLKSKYHKKAEVQLQSSGRKTRQLFKVNELSLSFGDRTLFSGLNFTINKGDKIALLGKNGAGKSSLLKILLGQVAPTKGLVEKAEGLDCGYFSQKRESLKPDSTPWDIIGEGIDYVISNTGDKRHVAGYLESFLFSSDELKRPIHTFSGGEKNRLQLAQFMKHARDLWIFDEPTNDLDLETIGVLEEELKSYEGALIIVGHDRSFLKNVTDKCWILEDGKLEFFEAGFEQALDYLEVRELEEQLKAKEEKNTNVTAIGSAKTGLTNKEKNRLEKLPQELEKVENKINDLKQKMAEVNFAQISPADKIKLEQWQSELSLKENDLDLLMNEWAELELKGQV